MRRPVEWGRREPESEPEPERLDTAPVDWHVVIRAAVDVALAEERRFNQAVLAEVVAEIRATTNDDLERAVRTLTVELSDLKATLAEVRLAFATDRTQALDLPNPLSKRADLNWGSMPDSRWLN